jgi:pyruvate/2-oxoglutarate dehydrogenase complex dihydrolipoamide dehydrogenase (E3) component
MHYEVLVIGAGPGGVEAARILGRNKVKVALVDYREIGGTCLNRGCIPAKTMLYSAEMFRHAKSLPEFGIDLCDTVPVLDFEKMIEKRNQIMDKIRNGYKRVTANDGVDFIDGFARFIDKNSVEINGTVYTADKFVLATGANSRKFPGFKDNDPRYFISDNIFSLKKMPKSIVIVGGGPVGVEFATFFHEFGVKVTMVDLAPNFLNFFEHDLGQFLISSYKRRGIDVFLETVIDSIDDSSEELKINLSNGETVVAECVLSAIGVLPDLSYAETLGLEQTRGRFSINESYQTTHDNIYAIGDVIGLSGSAYGAEREGLFVAHHILGEFADYYKVPYHHFPDPVFSYPEVGTVGYSSKELDDLGIEYVSAKAFYLANPKAVLKNDTQGFCKILANKKTGEILGAHFIGLDATELMHMLTIPVMYKMKISDLRRMVFGHPVVSEIVKDAVTECYIKLQS